MEKYPVLRKYNGKDDIPGFLGNIIFFVHNKTENGGSQGTEKAKFETEMVLQVCQHLLWNNMQPIEIQIISNSEQRLRSISTLQKQSESHAIRLIPRRSTDQNIDSEGNRVAVAVLVKTEQYWDEELMTRTIAKGISCSSDGIIIIAPFSAIMKPKEPAWSQLIDYMYQKGFMSPYLQLYCKSHQVACVEVQTPSDILYASPKGGCLEICGERPCRHHCSSICHPQTIEHNMKPFLCKFPCEYDCPNGHPCLQSCYKKCRCEFNCAFIKVCGHPSDNYSNMTCHKPCAEELPCGHTCDKLCHKKENLDHVNLKCNQPCIRRCKREVHFCLGHPCSTPCPPCTQEYFIDLNCGHELKIPCSDVEPDVDNYVCEKFCRKLYALCNHPCRKKCYEDCGVCEEPYPRKHPVCGHMILAPCHVPITALCKIGVPSYVPSKCEHNVQVPCYRGNTLTAAGVAQYCYTKCDTLLNLGKRDCGHYCYGSCWDCFQGRMHQRCTVACGKRLICSHECRVTCPQVCSPCNQKCMNVCEHYECPFECGVPCEYICEEVCSYNCPHLKCSKMCGEVCDRFGCMAPCPQILKCGHPCVGFCGELCPKLCRICHPDELLKGMFAGQSAVDDTDRFIYLDNCGHTIEEYSLAGWLTTKTEGREIELKGCPLCRMHISGLRRFSAALQENLNEVNQVKACIYGKETAIMEVVRTVLQKVRKLLEGQSPLMEFGSIFIRELNYPLKSYYKGGNFFHSMYQDKANFAEWVFNIWERASLQISLAENLWPPVHVLSYQKFYGELFGMIASRKWPMHPNEVSSIGRELNRIRDVHRLYSRLSLENEDHILKLANSPEGKLRFEEANSVLKAWVPYTKTVRRRFFQSFSLFMAVQSYTLEITENERQQIIRAFGSRAGRWFKCPNGHVYVVTECGGVTEISSCNECGETIGGENHRFLEGNNLASEMDGAEKPLYS